MSRTHQTDLTSDICLKRDTCCTRNARLTRDTCLTSHTCLTRDTCLTRHTSLTRDTSYGAVGASPALSHGGGATGGGSDTQHDSARGKVAHVSAGESCFMHIRESCFMHKSASLVCVQRNMCACKGTCVRAKEQVVKGTCRQRNMSSAKEHVVHLAVCCSVLQCVAACCSMLQRVAMCPLSWWLFLCVQKKTSLMLV